MSSDRTPPPDYPEQLIIALLGRNKHYMNSIGNIILSSSTEFINTENALSRGESNCYKVLNTPDFFDETSDKMDQQIIDFMASSLPGPNLFILVVDPHWFTEEVIIAQITKIQEIFGEGVTSHLVVMLPNADSLNSLSHLTEGFKVRLGIPLANLSRDCMKWCKRGHYFPYDFQNYSKDVVQRRKTALETRSSPLYEDIAHPQNPSPEYDEVSPMALQPVHRENAANGVGSNMFSLVILGMSGTGKSATANTILLADKHKGLFESQASSVPVTVRCGTRTVHKPFGRPVILVDTPDFFHEELANPQVHVKDCRRYCQPADCAILLVIQLGRITQGEVGILERLEERLGWNIRENTTVVLTHGDEMANQKMVQTYIYDHPGLSHIVEQCSNRFHVFNNKSKDSKQVIELVRKIPNYNLKFPKFTEKYDGDQCSIS